MNSREINAKFCKSKGIEKQIPYSGKHQTNVYGITLQTDKDTCKKLSIIIILKLVF